MLGVAAVILTKNEELHLERCLRSLFGLVEHILVVDCGSTDRTKQIAVQYGAKVLTNEWVNYSKQFNYGLSNVPVECNWVLRIDADEYVDQDLCDYVNGEVWNLEPDIAGISFVRQMCFLRKPIRFGAMFPIYQLRLFRRELGVCETRWMDEHIVLSEGKAIRGRGMIIDDNINPMGWWIEKHNGYSAREAVDILSYEYPTINPHINVSVSDSQAATKRRFKKLYAKLPIGLRSFVYFVYRYFFRLGFLDGTKGIMFHFLQGFWYRFLVDVKCYEVKEYARKNNVSVEVAIYEVLKIKV